MVASFPADVAGAGSAVVVGSSFFGEEDVIVFGPKGSGVVVGSSFLGEEDVIVFGPKRTPPARETQSTRPICFADVTQ
jgi:hypothetical protein